MMITVPSSSYDLTFPNHDIDPHLFVPYGELNVFRCCSFIGRWQKGLRGAPFVDLDVMCCIVLCSPSSCVCRSKQRLFVCLLYLRFHYRRSSCLRQYAAMMNNSRLASVFEDDSLKADSHIACRANAGPMPFPCHAVPVIHTCHAAPLPCSDSAVFFVKVRVVAGNIRTASPAV